MTGGKLIIDHHLLDSLIQLQKTHGIRHRRPALGYALCHLVLFEMELIQKPLVGQRFLYGIQVLSLNIFDQRDLHNLQIGIILDDHRYFFQARQLGRPPAPLTGNDLIEAVLFLYDQRLDNSKLFDGIRKLYKSVLIKLLSRLFRVWSHHGKLHLHFHRFFHNLLHNFFYNLCLLRRRFNGLRNQTIQSFSQTSSLYSHLTLPPC